METAKLGFEETASEWVNPSTVTVVIPTLNEAKNLPWVFERLSAEWEIIVVDGCSTDGTVEVVRELRPDAKVLLQRGRGKGQALAQGFAAATGDLIVMLDADGSADPNEIPEFVAALTGGAQFAKGSRFVAGGGSADITPLRRSGNAALGQLVNILFGTRYTDLCYGYNAFRRDVLPYLPSDCDGFEIETLINIRIARHRLRVTEVPSYEKARLNGASNLRPFRDGLRILRTIVRERLSTCATASGPATLEAVAPGRPMATGRPDAQKV